MEFLPPMERPVSAGRHIPPPGEEQPVGPHAPAAETADGGSGSRVPPLPPAPAPAKPGDELAHLRDERTKVFATADPTRFNAKVHTGPIHFKDAEGKWADIDNTFVEGRPGRVRTKANSFGVELAKRANEPMLVELSLPDGRAVGYGVDGARDRAVRTDKNNASYVDVLDNVDLELSARYTLLKEDIVLKSRDVPDSITFPLHVVGLTPQLDAESGSVHFVDEAGLARVTTPRGFMEDAKIEDRTGSGARSYDIRYELLGDAGRGWSLRVHFDRAYLDDPARMFPVRVDPILWPQPQSHPDDTTVQTGYTRDSTGDADLHVGRYTAENGDHTTRSFLHFDTSRVNGKIINWANLLLFEWHSWSCSPREMTVYRITSNWTGSTVTSFATPPSPQLDTVNVVNRASFAAGYSASCPDQYVTLNVTDAMRNWASGAWAQQGIALVSTAPESDVFGYKKFNAHNAGVNIPLLDIEYSEPNRAPNAPDSHSPANDALLRTTTPTLSARGTDPDGNNVAMRHRVYRESTGALVAGRDAGFMCNGCTDTFTTPALSSGRYIWDTWVYDGQYDSGVVRRSVRLDTTAPTDPSNLTSPTHTAGVASINKNIRVEWTASTDSTSSVAGYATSFDTNPTGDPGDTVNTTSTFAETTKQDGTFWFHVKAIDAVGNVSGRKDFGPIYIDGTAPTVVKTVSALAGGAANYARGQEVTYTITVTNTHPFAVDVSSVNDTAPATLAPTAGSLLVDAGACAAQPPPVPDPTFGPPSCSLAGRVLSTSGFSLAAAGQPNDRRVFTYKAVVLGEDRDCSTVTNAASATNGNGTTNAAVPVTVCEAGLGLEPWLSYVTKGLGPQAQASVNVANGNLVVQAVDSTPIQGHGRLAYVLRRTYNSKNSDILTLPGSLGAGWQLNVGQADDLIGDGVGATGIYVPSAESLLTPGALTLVDRDGTRHVFEPRALSARVNVTPGPGAPTGALGTLLPKSLSVDTTQASICVDQTYTAPAGVHVGLWRYVRVNLVGSNACAGATSSNSSVLGFAAVRTDRLRYEFNALGRITALVDANGNELRYTYDGLGRLSTVHEPRNCTDPGPSACRALRFDYSVANQTTVRDPANRATTYKFDSATPARLVALVNPDGTQVDYGYGTCNGRANQLCSVTDPSYDPAQPSRHKTTFAYETPPNGLAGAPRLATVTDRRGTTTQLTYAAGFVTADTAGQRKRFKSIDGIGRVGVTEDGDTANLYRRVSTQTWDGVGATCTEPDDRVDNNLCRVVRQSLTGATPDEDTSYTYNNEGARLVERRANATVAGTTGSQLATTFGFRVQYVQADGSVRTFDDAVAGSGGHTTSPTTGRGDGTTLFSVVDRTQSLTPRGNAAGTGYATYRTTFKVDNDANKPLNAVTSGTCTDPNTPTANTGNLCETSSPTFDGTNPTVSRSTYDNFGRKATTASPKAIAEANGGAVAVSRYTYYDDAVLDLSNGVSAGGWLKAVTDPAGEYVVFAYDRAGNVARTWDRDATDRAGRAIAEYPGTVSAPTAPDYTEELRATGTGITPFANPWRYVRSTRDALGGLTTITVDKNGNPLTVRPPRGNKAGTADFDISSTFDDGDLVRTRLLPEERAANKPTELRYDPRGNLVAEIDPLGNVRVHFYDSVDRRIETRFTRDAWPVDTATVPPACRQSTTGDAPLPAGRVLCTTTTAYDGVDNVIGTSDGDAQTTTSVYDGAHRLIRTLAPHGDPGLTSRVPNVVTSTQLRTENRYDADGNITTQCTPRQFATSEGNSANCTSTGTFSEHRVMDPAGRVSTSTRYRTATEAVTESFKYDAEGNQKELTDGEGRITRTEYNLLGRKVKQDVPRGPNVWHTTQWRYSPSGDVKTVIRPGRAELGNGSDGNLTVDGSTHPRSNPFRLPTGKQYGNVTLQNSGWLTVDAGTVGRLTANGTVTVCSTCGIELAGLGGAGGAGATGTTTATTGVGPGGGGPASGNTPAGGGGAGHSQSGGSGTIGLPGSTAGTGGPPYGNTNRPESLTTAELLGSGGGGGTGARNDLTGVGTGGHGGAGGGAIQITAASIVVQGTITANGLGGQAGTGPATLAGGGGGGGSGGTIWLAATSVNTSGATLNVSGGAGGGAPVGGSGSPGRVRVDADTVTGSGGATARPAGRITAYAYDAKHRLTQVVDGADNVEASSAGPTSADGGSNIRTAVNYDVEDRAVARFEPRAFQTSTLTPDAKFMARTDYDRNGRPVASYVPRYADGTSFDDPTGTVNGDQRAQCATSTRPTPVDGVPSYPSGVGVCVTRVQYDHAGRVIKHVLPTTTATQANRFADVTYTDDGRVSKVDAPSPDADLARVTSLTLLYDGSGRATFATDALGHQAKRTFFAGGLPKTVTEPPDGTTTHTTSYTYNAAGQATTMTDALNQVARRAYFNDGLLERQVDTGGNITRYVHDKAGNPTQVFSPSAVALDANNTSGTPTVNTYTYDNLVLTSTQPVSKDGSVRRRVTYAYDAAGRKTAQSTDKVNAAGTVLTAAGTQRFAYYDVDRTASEVGRDGATITTAYDAAGNPTRVADSASGSVLQATWYLDGSERTVDDGATAVRSAYNGAGKRTAKVDVSNGGTVTKPTTYRYNDAGLPIRAASAHVGNATADLDAAAVWKWTYDASARLETETTPKNQLATYTFNDDDTLDRLAVTIAGAEVATWTYTWDNLYRQKSQAFSGKGAGGATPVTATFSYDYDPAGRLSKFTDATGQRLFEWDANGNREKYGDQAFTYNADDSIATATDSTGGNLKTFSYHAFGGMADDGCTAYGFDGFDRLGSATERSGGGCGPSPKTVTYSYDGRDRQRSRTEGGVRTDFAYDGLDDDVVSEVKGSERLDYVFAAGSPKAVVKNRNTTTVGWLADDGHGNVSTVTDGAATAASAVTCTVRYDPFGTPISAPSEDNPCHTGSSDASVFYRGGRRDPATGAYQFGSRTYDPSKSAFLTPDSYRAGDSEKDLSIGVDPLTANRYSYVNGDPVNLVDPDGHEPCHSRDSDICSYLYTGEVRKGSEEKIAAWRVQQRKAQVYERNKTPTGKAVCKYMRPNAKCPTSAEEARDMMVDEYMSGATFKETFGITKEEALAELMKFIEVTQPYVEAAARVGQVGLSVLAGASCGPAAGVCGHVVYQFTDNMVADPREGRSLTHNLVGKDLVVSGLIGYAGPKIIGGAVKRVGAASAPARQAPQTARVAAGSGDDLAGALCRTNSFVPATLVLMADGTTKPIADVQVGDLVMATDPETGERGGRRVTDTIVGDGIKELLDIEIDGAVITATDGHPFWVDDQGRWVDAEGLEAGDVLLLADGGTATVGAVRERMEVRRVHNLTVDGIHTYYVLAGDDAVLVHNCAMPNGLVSASRGLESVFEGGSVRGRSIIGIRSGLLDDGFTQTLTNNRSGYLFRNSLGEEVRIMSRNGAWDIRIRNQFGNYLDEFGDVAPASATHGIPVYSR